VGLEKQAQRAGKAHVVVATPGRLQDLLDRRMLRLDGVSILVLDEADRMLDMGFQPQVDKIVKHVPAKRQTMFFSATLDGRVGNLARSYTNDPVRHEVHEDRPTISEANHRFLPVADDGKIERLVEVLREERGLALVFVRTKHGADKLKKKLGQRGIDSLALHGNKSQSQRESALGRFASGRVDVLIATDVAARGLDLDDITHVVNFDPPHDHTDYVHRVGRTARAGRSGAGVTFVVAAQRHDVSVMAGKLKLGREFEADGLRMSAPSQPRPRQSARSRGGQPRANQSRGRGRSRSRSRRA
jgi:superfamily II DNA/RNA helicase